MIKRPDKVIRYVALTISLAIMALIFSFSAQDAGESTETSGGIIRIIAPVINKDFEALTEEAQEKFMADIQFYVRKAAHFSIYAALGFFLAATFITYSFSSCYVRVGIGWGVSALYAVTDEFHQRFVAGRSCELRDMLIDSSGAFLGACVLLLIYMLFRKLRAKRVNS